MLKNNLKLLDDNEDLRGIHERDFADVLDVCRKYNLTLDLATSDVAIYLEDEFGEYISLNGYEE